MSTIPYFLRNPALDDQAQPPMTMAPAAAPQGMAAQVVQHPMHAMIAPLKGALLSSMRPAEDPGPEPAAMSQSDIEGMAPSTPPTMAASKQPTVRTMTPIERREDELTQGMAKKPEGFWQKFGHYAGMAGRIAGDIVAPGQTEMIVQGLGKEGIGPRANEFRNREMRGLEQEQSQQALQGAQTENLGATTAKTQEETKEAPAKAESEEGLQGAQTYRALHPLATSDFELWHQQNPNGTAQDFQNMQAKPLTPQDAESRNAIWDKIANQYHLPMGQFKAGMSSADAAQLAGSLNNVISRGQGAQSITIKQEGAGKAGDARSDKSFQYNQGELDKLTNPISQLTMRMGRMQDTLNQGSPQADALVGPELLTVMAGGQGSGLRMNEAEIARVVGGRSNWESLKASINKWQLDPSKANSITPDQRQQIRALVKTVSDKLNSKQEILNQAAGDLVNSDDPKEHRRIVQKARLGLNSIDEGNQAAQGGGNAPQGATQEVWLGGKLAGHVVNGAYVPLGGK